MSDSNDSSTLPVQTETERIGTNWRRAAVKLLPHVGSALDELLFGRLNDSRWTRLETTLKELGEMMEARQIPPENALSEDFGGLLETTGPIIGRTTSEKKRSMLRDLLLNAVSLPPTDPKWESARMAGDLLSALEPPSLAIVAALHQLNARDSVTGELERDGAFVILFKPLVVIIELEHWRLGLLRKCPLPQGQPRPNLVRHLSSSFLTPNRPVVTFSFIVLCYNF